MRKKGLPFLPSVVNTVDKRSQSRGKKLLMDAVEFLAQLEDVRRGLLRRIAAIRNKEPVYGTAREMEGLLNCLEETEREVRSGTRRVPREQYPLAASRIVIDQWPWGDPLGNEICALGRSYMEL